MSREYITDELGLDEGLMLLLCERISAGGKYRWPEQTDEEAESYQRAKQLVTGQIAQM